MASQPSQRLTGNTTARTYRMAQQSLAQKAEHDERRRQSFRAHEVRRPGEALADAIDRAASLKSRLLAIGAQIDAEEAEEQARRRDQELTTLGSPSALLRRAQRDWPEQCAGVKAVAAELGIGLAEAWHRVIKAGLDCLAEDEEQIA